MKKLFTLLFLFLAVQGMGQGLINLPETECETYSKIYVHESNIEGILSQLSINDGMLVWDKQKSGLDRIKDWVRKSPPVWESGFSYEKRQLGLLNGEYLQFCFSISSGSYYKLHREAIHATDIRINLNTDNILIGSKTVYVWIDEGEIKHSMNGVSSENKNNVLLLWEVHLEIINEIVSIKEVVDNRGRMINGY